MRIVDTYHVACYRLFNAPLIPAKAFGKPLAHLTPVISVANTSFVVSMAELAGVPVAALGPKIDSVSDSRLVIISALDFLFTGFSDLPRDDR